MRETEALDYRAAVEWLADRYGVQLEFEEESPEADRRRRERERLLKLLDDASGFYERYLWDSAEAEAARAYLRRARRSRPRRPRPSGSASRRWPRTAWPERPRARASAAPSWNGPGCWAAAATASASA